MTLAQKKPALNHIARFSDHVVVIGASAGGTEALEQLVNGLPANLSAAVLVVRHLSQETSASFLVRRLKAATSLPCLEAKEGTELRASHIYIAPSDNHLLVDDHKIWVIHGPRENRWRPAIDALFRSAAVSHGSRVIGVILSGMLDDGTAGMSAIKRCGGRCIVQDPGEATFPDMPQNALNNVAVDHCVPVATMPGLIGQLIKEHLPAGADIPKDILVEDRIVRATRSDTDTVEEIGEKSPVTCPDCGGVLWLLKHDGFLRYRCHTGHTYSPDRLLETQSEKIEETLWRALRMFEERRNVLRDLTRTGKIANSGSANERIQEAEQDIERLRDILRRAR